MLKLPFLKKQTKSFSKFLTMEINSCEIKCLAFYKENGELKIIGSASTPLEVGLVRNGVISDIEQVAKYAENTVVQATADIEGEIKDLIMGISSDLCPELVTTAKINRGSAEPITAKEFDEFQDKIKEAAFLQVQNIFSNQTGDTEADLELITSSIVYSKVDEQKVDNVIGRSAQVVEIAMYTAYSTSFHLQSIKKLSKKLGLNLLAISSQAFSLLKTLKETENESSDLVLIQINGDFTNVSVVFGGAIVANKSLHIGKKQFIAELGRLMGLTTEEASKVIDSHAAEKLSQSESIVVQNCLEEVLSLWLEGLGLLFSDFTGVKTFSPYIYLFGSATQISEIEELLVESPWTKSIPFKAPPEIKTLNMSDLSKVKDATGNIKDGKWVAVASLAYIYEELT